MRGAISLLDSGSRALSYFLGVIVLALAGAVYATSLDAADIAEWTRRMFGMTFLVLLSALVLATLFAWARMGRSVDGQVRDMCDGVHVMAIGWESRIPEILRAAGVTE